MSETAPTSEAPISADHAKVAKLEAQLEREKLQLEQNEAFGKYDTFVGPLNRGVDSHESYHAQRPHDGVYRDGSLGSSFRDAATGHASNADAYNAQNGMTRENVPAATEENPNPEGWTYREDEESSAARYYDKLIDGDQAQEAPELNYESMNIHQLALSAAKAVELGDPDEVKDIRAVLDERLLEEVTRPGTDKDEQHYHDELDRFDNLVKLAVSEREKKAAPVEVVPPIVPTPDVEPEDKPEPTKDSKEVPAPDVDKDAGPEKPAKSEYAIGDFIEVNGQKVQVTEVLRGADGYIAYEVINDVTKLRELVFKEDVKPFVEMEEKQSFRDRSKEWWENGKGKDLRNVFTLGYMGYLYGKIQEGVASIADVTINRGVNSTDLPEIQERKRWRNRLVLVAGILTVAVASRILSLEEINAHSAGGAGLGEGASLPDGSVDTEEALSPSEQEILDSMHPDEEVETSEARTDFIDQELPTPEALPVPDASYNIPEGEGGIQLLQNLGIDPAKWEVNADRLLAAHPEDFYRMEDGGVGISHAGWLSEATQADLNALK